MVIYDCSSWDMQCCLKSTLRASYLFTNVAIRLEDFGQLIVYTGTNIPKRQTYCVNVTYPAAVFITD